MTISTWYKDKTRHIRQRIIVEGDLVLQTPAHFGNGDGDEVTDMPLLLDPYDNKSPLLTGASLAGALRNYVRELNSTTSPDLLFGGDKEGDKGNEEGEQSPLIVADSLGENSGKTIRAGVRIDGKTRTAVDKALFDVQLWQAGTTFPLRFELLIGQKDDAAKLCQALATALDGLSSGHITLGARKRRGYGEVEVTEWRVKRYDLTKQKQLCDWLEHGNDTLPDEAKVTSLKEALDVQTLLEDNRQFFNLNATFALQGSLLIRANEGQGDIGPDMVHLHAKQPTGKSKPIISGTSLAGALRARAHRIANTFAPENKANELIVDVFGGTPHGKKGMQASRLTVKEKVIENGRADLVQNRVSIDRFTGGARDAALFNEQPVFAADETRVTVDLHLRNPKKSDIGLLLLLLKDLWTEDLPLGGESSVGRGRLQGRTATLTYKNGEVQMWELTAVAPNQLQFKQGDPAKLQTFVDALHTALQEGGQ